MLRKIRLPLTIIGVFIFLLLLKKAFPTFNEEQLAEDIKRYYFEYGVFTVFLAALIEGLLVVGWYLPGGLVIFLGVILAAGNPLLALCSVIATIIGFLSAYSIDYLLGRFGWYKLFIRFGLKGSLEEIKPKVQNHFIKTVFLSYWQPNLGTIVATSAGILHTPFSSFLLYSTIATILWSSFWGTVAYFLGMAIISYLGIIFLVALLSWTLFLVIKHRR